MPLHLSSNGGGIKTYLTQYISFLSLGETVLGDPSKTLFKVISSPDDFKDFLKEAVESVKHLQEKELGRHLH